MLKKARKLLKGNRGFTILELIVVIAIMGFLVALVAPRLVGVTESAKEPTCETNQQRLSDGVERMVTEKGGYPDKLRNLIPGTAIAGKKVNPLGETAGGSATGNNWMYADDDKDATFSKAFAKNNDLYVHTLSTSEITELKKLGITTIIDYQDGSEKGLGTNTSQTNKVLMVGSGASTADSNPAVDTDTIETSIATDDLLSDPDLMYRIVLGVGEGSGLIAENIMTSVGSCPTGMQHKYIGYGGYSIVLPRLKSTVARLEKGGTPSTTAKITKATAAGYDNTEATGTATVPSRVFKIAEAQEDFHFSILCPEGHKWPSTDVKMWKVTGTSK